MKWAEIRGLDGYEVSEAGDIRHVKRVRYRPVPENGKVRIQKAGVIYTRSVRKLVRENFG